jgi:hypothetical protein
MATSITGEADGRYGVKPDFGQPLITRPLTGNPRAGKLTNRYAEDSTDYGRYGHGQGTPDGDS